MIWVLIVIVGVIAAILLIAATRPSSFRIERSATIAAPPEVIFPHLDDFHRWPAWSPWERLDPALQRSYAGAERGQGAVYSWQGNGKVGAGRMEIMESIAPSRLVIQLDFLKPFESHNTTQFSLVATDAGTAVTWVMIGNSPFMFRVMGVFMSMDKLVGRDFERGLANLRGVVAG